MKIGDTVRLVVTNVMLRKVFSFPIEVADSKTESKNLLRPVKFMVIGTQKVLKNV